MSSTAAKQKRYRARQRKGEHVYRITITDSVIEALLESSRLNDFEALSRSCVERELADVLAQWAQMWLESAR